MTAAAQPALLPEGRWRFQVSTSRLLAAALLAIVMGNVGQIPVLNLGDRVAPLNINDIAIAAVLFVGAIAMVQARSLRLNDVSLAALVFAAIGALSALAGVERFGLSGVEIAGSLAYLARWLFYFALYVVVINCVAASDAERIWTALERAVLIIVAFGIVQAIWLPNFAFIVYPDARAMYDFDVQHHRLVSTILEPNIAAGMIVLVLLVQLARLASGARVPPWKPVLLFAGLVATLSRSGMFSFAIGCGVLLLMRGLSRRLLRLAGLVLVLLLSALPVILPYALEIDRFGVGDSSAMARVVVWLRAISTFLEHPWFGIGFNTYGFVQERRGFERIGGSAYSVEGGLLFVAVLTGVVGLSVYLAMLWFALRRAKRHVRDAHATPEERGLLTGAVAATIAILVDSVFVNSLLTPWVMEPLWVLWGLAFVVATDLRRRASHGASRMTLP